MWKITISLCFLPLPLLKPQSEAFWLSKWNSLVNNELIMAIIPDAFFEPIFGMFPLLFTDVWCESQAPVGDYNKRQMEKFLCEWESIYWLFVLSVIYGHITLHNSRNWKRRPEKISSMFKINSRFILSLFKTNLDAMSRDIQGPF